MNAAGKSSTGMKSVRIRSAGIAAAVCAALLLCAGISTLSAQAWSDTSTGAPAQNPPPLAGKTAISLDIQSDEIIYTKNIDEKVYPASTTKVLTAILLEESSRSSDILTYSAAAKAAYPYALDLPVGDTLEAAAVLDALLLYSANDVAIMIAENVAGSVGAFTERMNAKARELGLHNSHFANPHGLHHPDHYTTAYDLCLLARALAGYPRIMAVMGQREARIQSGSGLIFEFENRNKLAGISGCLAGKTGYTDEAGRCLLAVYKRDGRTMVGVVMKSEYDREDTTVFRDMEALMDWSYRAGKTRLYPSGEPLGQINAEVKLLPGVGPRRSFAVPLFLREAVWIYANDEEKDTELDIPPIDPWKLREDAAVGHLVVRGRLSVSRHALYPTVAAVDVLSTYKLFYILVAVGLLAFSGTVVSLLLWRRAKRRLNISPP